METAEWVLRLYQEKYFDLNVRHFHEKLQEVEDRLELQLGEAGVARRRTGSASRARRILLQASKAQR
jgi:hypothetical protein